MLLSSVTWTGAAGDNQWTTPGNWSTDALPGAGDDVTINVAANPTIQVNCGAQPVHSLASSDPLNISGTLAVATTAQLSANITLAGGILKGGTYASSNGANLSASNGSTLDGVTLAANLSFTNQTINVINGLTLLNGATVTTTQTGPFGSQLNFVGGGQTLAGSGQVVFESVNSNGGANNVLQETSNLPLTIGAGVTVRADTGIASLSGNFVNEGTITAAGSGTEMLLGNVSNRGTVQALDGGTLNLSGNLGGGNLVENNGTVDLGGTFTQAGLGRFTRTSGSVNIQGMLTGGLALDSGTGVWVLNSGAISGGTVSATGGASLAAVAAPQNFVAGTLDGVTLAANLSFTNQTVNVINGLTLANGAVITMTQTDPYGCEMVFHGSQTLGGSGQLVFEGNSSGSGSALQPAYGVSATLTIGPGITLRTDTGNASLQIPTINGGTISADGLRTFIETGHGGAPFTNNGMVQVSAGTANLIPQRYPGRGGMQQRSWSSRIPLAFNAFRRVLVCDALAAAFRF